MTEPTVGSRQSWVVIVRWFEGARVPEQTYRFTSEEAARASAAAYIDGRGTGDMRHVRSVEVRYV